MKTAVLKVPTTIRVTPRHAAKLKQLSAQTGRTVTSIVEEAILKHSGDDDPRALSIGGTCVQVTLTPATQQRFNAIRTLKHCEGLSDETILNEYVRFCLIKKTS